MAIVGLGGPHLAAAVLLVMLAVTLVSLSAVESARRASTLPT